MAMKWYSTLPIPGASTSDAVYNHTQDPTIFAESGSYPSAEGFSQHIVSPVPRVVWIKYICLKISNITSYLQAYNGTNMIIDKFYKNYIKKKKN